MAEYDIPLFAIVDRSSWGYLTRRNVIVTAGDDFSVTLTVYEDEDATTPITTIGAWSILSIYDGERHFGSDFWGFWSRSWDYGMWGWAGRQPHPLFQVFNAPISDPTLGQFVFAVPPADTRCLSGRFAFVIQYEGTSAGASIVRGIMEIRPGMVFPDRNGFVLDDGSGNGSYLDGPDVTQ